jgi:lipopolysaccharide biosynthesis protein
MNSKLRSLGYFLLDSNKSFSEFLFDRQQISKKLLPEDKSTKLFIDGVALTAHVYYADFIPKLFKLTEDWPRGSKLFVSTTSVELKEEILDYFAKSRFTLDVRVVPNIGRNFAPLLVEFSKTLQNFEYFVHVHSKKSSHSRNGMGAEWGMRNLHLLLEPSHLNRAILLMKRWQNVGIVFADSRDLLRGLNFRWGQNRAPTKKLFEAIPGFEKIRWRGRISFPAGGMFLARSSSVREILDLPWSYDLFPPEQGQLDGTLQHGIERLFGELPLAKGLSQAIFLTRMDGFYIETLDRF